MLRLKSLKELTNPEDGLGILIARYRPRYLPKDNELGSMVERFGSKQSAL